MRRWLDRLDARSHLANCESQLDYHFEKGLSHAHPRVHSASQPEPITDQDLGTAPKFTGICVFRFVGPSLPNCNFRVSD